MCKMDLCRNQKTKNCPVCKEHFYYASVWYFYYHEKKLCKFAGVIILILHTFIYLSNWICNVFFLFCMHEEHTFMSRNVWYLMNFLNESIFTIYVIIFIFTDHLDWGTIANTASMRCVNGHHINQIGNNSKCKLHILSN